MTRLYLQRALGEAASMGLDIVTAGAKLSIEETMRSRTYDRLP